MVTYPNTRRTDNTHYTQTGLIQGERAYATADQEVTDDTLVNSTYLTASVFANGFYHFRFICFFLNDGATEGFKAAVNGTCTATDLKAQILIYDDTLNTIVGFARATTLGTGVGAGLSTGSNFAVIEGTIDVNTAGTLRLQFAQNAAGANLGVHLEVGSSYILTRLA